MGERVELAFEEEGEVGVADDFGDGPGEEEGGVEGGAGGGGEERGDDGPDDEEAREDLEERGREWGADQAFIGGKRREIWDGVSLLNSGKRGSVEEGRGRRVVVVAVVM